MIKPLALGAAFVTLPLIGLSQTVDSVGYEKSYKFNDDKFEVEANVISDEPDMAGGLTALLNYSMASVKDIDAREGSGDHECTSDKSDENEGLSISIGGMVFMQPMDFLNGEFMPVTSGDWAMTPRQAKQVSINFRNQDQIGQSSFWLRRGLCFSSYVMNFGPDRYLGLVEGQNSGIAIVDSDSDLMKSNFSVGYIELPLSLVYNCSASGSKGLSLAIGGFAGLRGRAETQTLRRMDSGWLRQTTLNGFYTNRFAYGVQTEIGYKEYFVASRMNLNPFFQQRADVSTPLIMAATMSVGIHL